MSELQQDPKKSTKQEKVPKSDVHPLIKNTASPMWLRLRRKSCACAMNGFFTISCMGNIKLLIVNTKTSHGWISLWNTKILLCDSKLFL